MNIHIDNIVGSAVLVGMIAVGSAAAHQPAKPAPQQPVQPTGAGQTQPTMPPTGTTQQGTAQPQPVGTAGTHTPTVVGTQSGGGVAATGGQQIPGPTTAACAQAAVSTALPLLDRLQRLLDGAIKNELGKVSLDRATIDEMRAEVAQIRTAIQPVKP